MTAVPNAENLVVASVIGPIVTLNWTAPAGHVPGTTVNYTINFRFLCDFTGGSFAFSLSDAAPSASFPMANGTFAITISVPGSRVSLPVYVDVGTSTDSFNGSMLVDTGSPHLIGSDGTSWGLVTSGLPYAVTANGIPDATTSNVIQLVYRDQKIYFQDKNYNWKYKTTRGSLWTQAADPRQGSLGAGNLPAQYTLVNSPSTVISPHGDVSMLSAPQVVLIFWGSYWRTASSPSGADIVSAMTDIYASPYFTGLQEYGIKQKPTILHGYFIFTDPPDLSLSGGQTEVGNFLNGLFVGNSISPLPTETDNLLYLVVLPPDAGNMNGGDHGSKSYQGVPFSYGWAFYDSGFGLNSTTLNSYTINLTRVTVNAVTNPYNHGWFGVNNGSYTDVENHTQIASTVASQQVYGFFSNRLNGIIVPQSETVSPPAPTPPPAPPPVPAGVRVFSNGVLVPGGSSNVALLLYWNHTIYEQDISGTWYVLANTTWTISSDPRPGVQRNYWQLAGGDGTAGTPGGASVWVTPLGDGASWGIATDDDTIDLRHGGSIHLSSGGGDVQWISSPTDPLVTFVTSTDAYQRVPGFSATMHAPVGSYTPGPLFGASLGRNLFNILDPVGNPGKAYSFGNINVQTITAGGTVFASTAELDDPLSDHWGEDQENNGFGYNGIAGLLTGYDFDATRPNYPHIQHMLRYLIDPTFLASGNPDGLDVLGNRSWPCARQDFQNVVQYTGHLLPGSTIGIPMDAVMPTTLSTYGQMIWWTLQHYGAIWRGALLNGGGVFFSVSQDVDPAIVTALNADLPSIVPFLCPLRNQHVGGLPFITSPKNAPGVRVDIGPPLLAPVLGTIAPPAPVPLPIPIVTKAFSTYWDALSAEIEKNQDLLFGFMINSGDPQGASGKQDSGVLNTPAAGVIAGHLAGIKK